MNKQKLLLIVLGLSSAGLTYLVLPLLRRDSMSRAVCYLREYIDERLQSFSLLQEKREQEVRQSCLSCLPDLFELMSLGLQAGLSADSSMGLYIERYSTPLSKQLETALTQSRLGLLPRSSAFQELAVYLQLPAFSRFVGLLEESLTFGSPLASSLELQAELLRGEERLRMEEQLEKLPVKMLIPLGTLIVPAMLIAIMGPLLAGALVAM